jgi:hypothetical protein
MNILGSLFEPLGVAIFILDSSAVFQVVFPLHGKKVFFPGVAFLANRNHVSFGAPASPNEGYDVIHGQIPGRNFFPAIVADPFGQPLLPPSGLLEFPRPIPLAPNVFFFNFNDKGLPRHWAQGPGVRSFI